MEWPLSPTAVSGLSRQHHQPMLIGRQVSFFPLWPTHNSGGRKVIEPTLGDIPGHVGGARDR
jgi:hypothetical protein